VGIADELGTFSYWVHVFRWRHTHNSVRSQDARFQTD